MVESKFWGPRVKNITKVENNKIQAYRKWLSGWWEVITDPDTKEDKAVLYVMTKHGLCKGEIPMPKKRTECK